MLIDSNKNILDASNFKKFDEGNCANLYRNNNVVLKYYKCDCKKIYYFSRKTFNKLKEIDLDSFVKLYNYYYFKEKSINNPLILPSIYTMEFIDNPNISLLNQNKEYLLDIISSLEKDINILANNKIKMYDAHYKNIIFQENNAKIIDIDLYRNVILESYKQILLHNKEQLLYYIISTLKHELKEQNLYNYRFEYIFCPYELSFMHVTDYLNKTINDDNIKNSIIKKLKK